MSDDIQYPDHFIERLHTIWGEGFLSSGGREEVGEIVAGLDLDGKTVLDIGFGTGGPAIVLAKDHGVGKVVGIDVEPQLLDKATKNVEQAQVAEKVELKIVNLKRSHSCVERADQPASVQVAFAEPMALTKRLLEQQHHDKKKLYALHAPEVECIAKGKAHKRYEFGVKVSIATNN